MSDSREVAVPLILLRSREVSGREPIYEMPGEEVELTIWARPSPPPVGEST